MTCRVCRTAAVLLLAVLLLSLVQSLKFGAKVRTVKEAKEITVPRAEGKYQWNLHPVAFSLLPLAPGARRKTITEVVVKNKIWTMDQIQGIISVNVPVRSTIVKLKGGGLWMYNPVAPTEECIEVVRGLEALHGPVQHIVLGTLGLVRQ
jgi:hypothetical protein